MKKSIVFLSLLLLISTAHIKAQGFEFGFKTGTDMQKITGASFTNKFAFGYHFGFFAQLKLTSSFGIQPELYYSGVNIGTASQLDALYQIYNVSNMRFGYVNVPVLVNFRFNKLLDFQLGPKFSILSDKNKTVFGNGGKAIKSGDMSLVAGVQLHVARMKIYGRYQVGINNVNNFPDAVNAAIASEKWKSQVIHIGIAMRML